MKISMLIEDWAKIGPTVSQSWVCQSSTSRRKVLSFREKMDWPKKSWTGRGQNNKFTEKARSIKKKDGPVRDKIVGSLESWTDKKKLDQSGTKQ